MIQCLHIIKYIIMSKNHDSIESTPEKGEKASLEKLKNLYDQRLDAITDIPSEKLRGNFYNYDSRRPNKEIFDFLYSSYSAERTRSLTEAWIVELKSGRGTIIDQADFVKSSTDTISTLRQRIAELRKDSAENLRTPMLRTSTWTKGKNFPKSAEIAYAEIGQEIDFAQSDLQDGVGDKEQIFESLRQLDDMLREDANLFRSLNNEMSEIFSTRDLTEKLDDIRITTDIITKMSTAKIELANTPPAPAEKSRYKYESGDWSDNRPQYQNPVEAPRRTTTPAYFEMFGLTLEDMKDPAEFQKKLKTKYRTLAQERHPDKHPNNPGATRTFQDLSTANAALSDPKELDKYLSQWQNGAKE